MKQYSFLTESSRLRRALNSGELSSKAISKLRSARMLPSKQKYIDGFEKGTQGILRHASKKTGLGYKVVPAKNVFDTKTMVIDDKMRPLLKKSIKNIENSPYKDIDSIGGAYRVMKNAVSNKNPVTVSIPDIPQRSGKHKLQTLLKRRHEAEEFNHFMDTNPGKVVKGKYVLKDLSDGEKLNNYLSDLPGSHGVKVLKKEKKAHDLLSHQLGIKDPDYSKFKITDMDIFGNTSLYRSPEEIAHANLSNRQLNKIIKRNPFYVSN